MSARSTPGAATRAAAARVVEQVIAAGRTLDAALEGSSDTDSLHPGDRAQVRALAYGALRWHHRHRALLAQLLDRPLPRRETLLEALLSVGMFQLLDESQPDYAAVSATVEAARLLGRRHAAGLVNASLRRLQREQATLLGALSLDAAVSHPQWMTGKLAADWPVEWRDVCAAAQLPPPLWLRVNLARTSVADMLRRFESAGMAAMAGDIGGSIRLANAVAVEAIPGFAEGLVSVQDAASQLAAPLLAVASGMRVLDACAAPGGKTMHLLECAQGDIDLVALDIDATRLARVASNLARGGYRARLLAADARDTASWWDSRRFDRILIDAPCSGTGVIRRHPDIKLLRRPTDMAGFAIRQLELLGALWPLLAPGGCLLYATCSILREENDGVVSRFVARTPGVRLAPAAPPPVLRPSARGGVAGPAGSSRYGRPLLCFNNTRTSLNSLPNNNRAEVRSSYARLLQPYFRPCRPQPTVALHPTGGGRQRRCPHRQPA
ncbi:MAG: 16S rRNA (cytosine(967)-C(5))-methyltransferase RsmB [Gammaproteobacteria bacterium]|nr:16S rRNA (cytosine(967)-C(5))-methyltransferase RsmB [Gammaproteobacteria bacterium]